MGDDNVWKVSNGSNASNFSTDPVLDSVLIDCRALWFCQELINFLIETKLRFLIDSSTTSFGSGACLPSVDTIKNNIEGIGGGLLKCSSPSYNKDSTRLPPSISLSCEYERKSINFDGFFSITLASLIDRDKLIAGVISCASTMAINKIQVDSKITSVSCIIEKTGTRCSIGNRL